VTDYAGFELTFEEGEISFLFQFEPGERWSDEETAAIRRATRKMGEFLVAYPHRRELRLTSISVRADDDLESTFFKGRLPEGVALLDPFVRSAGLVGVPEEGSLPLLAGLSPKLPREKAVFARRGLVIYGEPQPKPDEPSRITRMTVFLPLESGETTDEYEDEEDSGD
jgi:hypothetical protein